MYTFRNVRPLVFSFQWTHVRLYKTDNPFLIYFVHVCCVLRDSTTSVLKGDMSPHTHARTNENKLEKVGQSFSSSVGDFARLFLSV